VFYKIVLVTVVLYCVELAVTPYGKDNIVWGAEYRVLRRVLVHKWKLLTEVLTKLSI